MRDEELAVIRAQWITYAGPLEPVIGQMRVLLAEVEAWRELGRAIAASTTQEAYRMRDDTPMISVLAVPSDTFDPVWRARELLAEGRATP